MNKINKFEIVYLVFNYVLISIEELIFAQF